MRTVIVLRVAPTSALCLALLLAGCTKDPEGGSASEHLRA
jgi:hypothetical protein